MNRHTTLPILPHRTMSLLAALALLVTALSTAFAVVPINPVSVGTYAENILQVKVGPLGAASALPVEVVKVLQGKAPNRLALTLADDAALRGKLQQAFAGEAQPQAVLFDADFWGAGNAATGNAPAGALRIGAAWFALRKAPDGTLVISPDALDFSAVWGGADEALDQVIAYAQATQGADTGIRWSGDRQVADLQGAVNGAQAVELMGDGRPCLFIMAATGDRVYRFAEDGTPEDLTATLGLTTKSKCAAWGDFNGDGLLDLASWDGTTLTVQARTAAGALDAKPLASRPLSTGVSLAAADGGGLVVGTTSTPLLLKVTDLGRFGGGFLSPPGPADPNGATPGPCVVADFDNDGIADILQPQPRGLALYKGKGAGAFAAPQQVGSMVLPRGLSSAFTGDFDGDGRLDLAVAGRTGCAVLRNAGPSGFHMAVQGLGGIRDLSRSFLGSATLDANNDGRQDLLLTYSKMLPQFLINHGFTNFVQSGDLGLAGAAETKEGSTEPGRPAWEMPCAKDLEAGQPATAIADFNGDGAEDVAFASPTGKVWMVLSDVKDVPRYGLTVAVPAGAGPLRVVAYDGKRCLGARMAAPGMPAFFGKANKGPIKLEWQTADGKAANKTVVVLKSARIELPAQAN